MTYAPIATNRLGRPASGFGLLLPLRQLLNYAGQLVEARRARREIVRLARAEETTLADIGIERSDIDWALMQPWDTDPSLALEKRFNRRKAVQPPESGQALGVEILRST